MNISAIIWRKSSRSGGGGNNCVEVTLVTRQLARTESLGHNLLGRKPANSPEKESIE
ncbi:DUF397 domain-containing protein [Actinoallomurus sp. NBC_01490]|uniref:DUF397 domain-containing protein n=1 Tax=Actinoallomurus sp. NBC_01490 TaxID=2903557 RepID=UPI003FA46F9F